MAERGRLADELLAQARLIPEPACTRFLVERTAGDAALRAAVESRLGRRLDVEPPPTRAPSAPTEDEHATVSLGDVEVTPSKPSSDGSARETLRAGLVLDHYRLDDTVGRGGIGVVFRGHDERLGREVALKFLRDELAANKGAVQRFVDEARICGQLQHPGIVPVYDFGRHGRVPYFAMKLIRGDTLRKELERREDPSDRRRHFISLLLQVSRTVGYAHARRVVHRDLKPDNVMVGRFGEVQVVDWGLAKLLTESDQPHSTVITIEREDALRSLDGSILGTPAYMPPEQAQGYVEHLDERSDVFALGAILCEILTGRPPYRGTTTGELLNAARSANLTEARSDLAACGAPEELVDLAVACLAPKVGDRPADASLVADRLEAWLAAADDEIHAARVRAAEARLRARVTLGVAVATVLLLLTAGAATWWVRSAASARRVDADSRVAAALQRASELAGRARAVGASEPARWDELAGAIEQVQIVAQAIDVTEPTREAAQGFVRDVTLERTAALAEAERLASNATMLDRLVALRVPEGEALEWDLDQAGRMCSEYADAMADYLREPAGTRLVDLDADSVTARLAEQGRGIERELSLALDHWALLARPLDGPDVAARLHALAERLHTDPWLEQVRALVGADDPTSASVEALTALGLGPEPSALGALVYGEALSGVGARELAADVLRRALELFPDDLGVAARLTTALGSLDPKPLDEIAATWRVARAIRPDLASVLHRQGIALAAAGRDEEALRAFEDLVRDDPESWHWHNHVGMELAALDRIDEAAAAFEKSVALSPDAESAWVNLGDAYFLLGDLERSDRAYERAVDVAVDRTARLNLLAVTHLRRDRPEQAAAAAEHALALGLDSPSAHCNAAVARSLLGDHEQALAHIRRAYALDPDRAKFVTDLLSCLRMRDLHDEAVAVGRDFVTRHPDEPSAVVAYIETLYRADRREEATREIARIARDLELRADGHERLEELAFALSDGDRLEEAVLVFQRMLAQQEADAPTHFNLGVRLAPIDRAAALGHLEQALELWRGDRSDFARRWRSITIEQMERIRGETPR